MVRVVDVAGHVDDRVVRVALSAVAGLVVEGDRYWLTPDPSQLGAVVTRMLTVCGPLTPAEVLAGVSRAARPSPARTTDTPVAVLLAYLASQPDYRLADDRI